MTVVWLFFLINCFNYFSSLSFKDITASSLKSIINFIDSVLLCTLYTFISVPSSRGSASEKKNVKKTEAIVINAFHFSRKMTKKERQKEATREEWH